AATTAIAMGGWPRRALSAQTGALAASEWDYRTTKELVAALQARKISASELTDRVIARIEAVDTRIGAGGQESEYAASSVVWHADAASAQHADQSSPARQSRLQDFDSSLHDRAIDLHQEVARPRRLCSPAARTPQGPASEQTDGVRRPADGG